MRPEQIKVLGDILQSDCPLQVINDYAGSGKTELMAALAAAYLENRNHPDEIIIVTTARKLLCPELKKTFAKFVPPDRVAMMGITQDGDDLFNISINDAVNTQLKTEISHLDNLKRRIQAAVSDGEKETALRLHGDYHSYLQEMYLTRQYELQTAA